MTVLIARCSEAKDMQYFDFHEAFKFYILSNIVITRYEYKIYKIIIDIVYIMYIYSIYNVHIYTCKASEYLCSRCHSGIR